MEPDYKALKNLKSQIKKNKEEKYKERWAKPVKMPKWIALKLADAREQRKKDKENSNA